MKGTTIIQKLLALPALAWVVGFNFYFQPQHLASHHQSHEREIAHHHHHDHGHGHHHHHNDEEEPEHTSDDHERPSFIQAKQKENVAPIEIQALVVFETTFNLVPLLDHFLEPPPDKKLTIHRRNSQPRGPPILLS